jgi:hypothetical protein
MALEVAKGVGNPCQMSSAALCTTHLRVRGGLQREAHVCSAL